MGGENGGGPSWLLFAWSPGGYRLREFEGEPPEPGTELEDDGNRLEVLKLGVSPLPDDWRPCAYSVGASASAGRRPVRVSY